MRAPLLVTLAGATMLGTLGFSAYQSAHRFNPTVELLAAHKPVFGLYAPSNPRTGGGRRGGAPPAADAPPPAPAKSEAELAQQALGYKLADFTFDGSMEGDFDKAFPTFVAYMKGLQAGNNVRKTPFAHLAVPMIVKTHNVGENPTLAAERIGKQLNVGVVGIMFPGVESAAEVQAGLAAMRFKSHGGTRSDNVGDAPAAWGMSEKEYKQKADLWPLNPNGELVNWTIVESKEGLAHIREIAAVKGIGVLWPGAGTLRGVFSTTVDGKRVFDSAGWENAIQQVLSACKEFNVPCGFPSNEGDIEMRMKQGFSVFVMNWGEPGQRTVVLGRKIGGRTDGDTGSTYEP
ncbi:MAG: aldolase/citrate lyase family protein [Gemmatimonadaceae bacterium]